MIFIEEKYNQTITKEDITKNGFVVYLHTFENNLETTRIVRNTNQTPTFVGSLEIDEEYTRTTEFVALTSQAFGYLLKVELSRGPNWSPALEDTVNHICHLLRTAPDYVDTFNRELEKIYHPDNTTLTQEAKLELASYMCYWKTSQQFICRNCPKETIYDYVEYGAHYMDDFIQNSKFDIHCYEELLDNKYFDWETFITNNEQHINMELLATACCNLPDTPIPPAVIKWLRVQCNIDDSIPDSWVIHLASSCDTINQ